MTLEIETDLQELYRRGYAVGIGGIRCACPEDLYRNAEHKYRDAWIDGYHDGLREYRYKRDKDKGWYGNFTDKRKWHIGKLHVSNDGAFIRIMRDANGETLASVRLIDATVVIEPNDDCTPEYAFYVARAIMKASAIAAKIQDDRKAAK